VKKNNKEKMYVLPISRTPLHPHSAKLRSGHITQYIWFAPAVARPIFASVSLRQTSDMLKRYRKFLRAINGLMD